MIVTRIAITVQNASADTFGIKTTFPVHVAYLQAVSRATG